MYSVGLFCVSARPLLTRCQASSDTARESHNAALLFSRNTVTICDTLRPHVHLSEAPPSTQHPFIYLLFFRNTVSMSDAYTRRPYLHLSEAPPSPKTPLFPHAPSAPSSEAQGLMERRMGDDVTTFGDDVRTLHVADALNVLGVAPHQNGI